MNKLGSILLVLTSAAALSLAYPAKADTITTFNVSGTSQPGSSGFTGTMFGGTLTINVTTGMVTGINVIFQGLPAFDSISASQASGSSNWLVGANSVGGSYVLALYFTTGHTPASLVGFTGGTILDLSFVIPTSGLPVPVYTITDGSITAPAGVPDAGSTLPLLGFASLGLVALRRKLRC